MKEERESAEHVRSVRTFAKTFYMHIEERFCQRHYCNVSLRNKKKYGCVQVLLYIITMDVNLL